MFTSRKTLTAPLPVEDGTVLAQILTADKEASQKQYETATFGIG